MKGLTGIGMIVGAVTVIGATVFGAQPASAHCHHHHHWCGGYGGYGPYGGYRGYNGYGYGYGGYVPRPVYNYPVVYRGYGFIRMEPDYLLA